MLPRPPIDLPYPAEHIDLDAVFSDPQIDPSAWIAPNAIVIGRVKIGPRASVWYNCVLRGDGERRRKASRDRSPFRSSP